MNRRLAAITAAVVLTTAGVAACVRTPATITAVEAVPEGSPSNAPSLLPTPSPSPTVVNVYAAAGANRVSPALANDRPLIYVPNSQSDDMTVIDPATYQVESDVMDSSTNAAGGDRGAGRVAVATAPIRCPGAARLPSR
jgi:YVTN family beta-propeller protein